MDGVLSIDLIIGTSNFYDFLPLTPSRGQFFITIRRQIWQMFNPSPQKKLPTS